MSWVEDDMEYWDGDATQRTRMGLLMLKKRRSFDDAERLRNNIRTLPMDRMRIDVELCGQLLIMRRREAHLQNIVACLQTLTQTLSSTNASLRNDYTDHQKILEELEGGMSVLQTVEGQRTTAEAMSQETQALAYESAQFLIDDLWHMASQPRQKVLELREKVFGSSPTSSSKDTFGGPTTPRGSRRLRPGVRGAHGRFNRIQTMLDGRDVLVDMLGRTESEAEEEERLGLEQTRRREESLDSEGEGEPVEHQGLRPTWVLRLFNYWGTRWGTRGTAGPSVVTANGPNEQEQEGEVQSSAGKENRNGQINGHVDTSGNEEDRKDNSLAEMGRNALSTSIEAWREATSHRKSATKSNTA